MAASVVLDGKIVHNSVVNKYNQGNVLTRVQFWPLLNITNCPDGFCTLEMLAIKALSNIGVSANV